MQNNITYSNESRTLAAVVRPFITPAAGGGLFQGVFFQPTINNRGDVAFAAIVQTALGVQNVPDNGEPYIGLGTGIFRPTRKARSPGW